MHSRRSFFKILSLIPLVNPDKLISALSKPKKLLNRVFPTLFAKDFVSVQPMSNPSGLTFYMDFKYSLPNDKFNQLPSSSPNIHLPRGRIHDIMNGWGTVRLDENNQEFIVWDYEHHLSIPEIKIKRQKHLEYMRSLPPPKFDKIMFPIIKNPDIENQYSWLDQRE